MLPPQLSVLENGIETLSANATDQKLTFVCRQVRHHVLNLRTSLPPCIIETVNIHHIIMLALTTTCNYAYTVYHTTGFLWASYTTQSKRITFHVLDRKSTRLNSSHVKISYA